MTALKYINFSERGSQVPDGLGVRIPDSHSGGPGSIPGQGALFKILLGCEPFRALAMGRGFLKKRKLFCYILLKLSLGHTFLGYKGLDIDP